jgi:hypothetical protein
MAIAMLSLGATFKPLLTGIVTSLIGTVLIGQTIAEARAVRAKNS